MSIGLKILVFWAKNEHLRAFDTNFCVRFACYARRSDSRIRWDKCQCAKDIANHLGRGGRIVMVL